jgi:diaminopimelate epimerase
LKLSFYKYHGTGNDFILVDNREGLFKLQTRDISRLCHRRFGIGADGLILLNKVEAYDFGMQYFNADGRESTMCGNGGRCVVAFADFLSLSAGPFRFLGIDGGHTGIILSRQGTESQVRLSMQNVKECKISGDGYLLDTGSPHLVRFVDDTDAVDVVFEGRRIRNLPEYLPDGINVNFVRYEKEELSVRTYERGVEDETLSCGTGVTAAALAYASVANINTGPVRVRTRGGNLSVYFRKSAGAYSDIHLEGAAVRVFKGEAEVGPANFQGHL